ncbi:MULTISPECIES: TetR/AcrR family transcriptional regulator [Thermomonosporaceae]|uniref:TetR/AcrR family transcriptional regulator n=1 Tax=Thermomonosporaceae TaxID=2012 RepID=UPI00255AC3D4|nr:MULTISPECIES: TetR/AcrR family transcriptional regulator [Thermomonosporaceae]MDL4772322.1 TetR/AcrR family transcriptional regulator [Actinomadura xylanilytica]
MKTDEKILTAATRHLNEDPSASMAEIAEATGVSRATLHRHFASREALLHALGERATSRWERSLRAAGVEAAGSSGDPAAMEAALTAMMRAYVADADEYGFALTDHFINNLPDLMAWTEELVDREVAFYTACQRAGVLRDDVPARWISNIVCGMLIAAREGLRRGDVARRDVERLLLTTFLHGTGAPRDRSGERP